MDPDIITQDSLRLGLNLGLFVLRVVVGVTLALHGVAKFRGGIRGVGNWFDAEGLRPGLLHAWLAACVEIGAGLGLALGLLTPFSAMAFVGVMATAGWVGHRTNGFFIIREGWEYVFVLAAAAAAVAATGPGEWSVDHALGLAWHGPAWLAVAAAGGLISAVSLLAVCYRPSAPSEQ
ncbi:DoxX family protein [Candidatus Poriferisodalis sp.]|uniref:DoxX family protein n=1 Tax=Candidatus Poriferisodalis sp. TaxID=3101277 RepID=UPI003B010C38